MRSFMFCFFVILSALTLACGDIKTARAAAPPQIADAVQLHLERFALVPVLHEGRIKPMDSFARSLLKRLSGQESGALQWLTDTLFNPAYAEKTRVLKIRNPDVVNLLQISRRKDKLYNYIEIKEALAQRRDVLTSIIQTPQEQWTAAQKDFVALSENMVVLGELLSSLSLFLPLSVTLPDDVPEAYAGLAGQVLSYVQVLKVQEDLRADVIRLVKEKGEDISTYTAAEQALAYLSFSTENIRASAAGSEVFKVIPAQYGATAYAPWQIISEGQGSPQTAVHFDLWAQAARAYHKQDMQGWDKAIQDIYSHSVEGGWGDVIRPQALTAERYYNVFSPFYVSTALYLTALLTLIAFSALQKVAYLKTALVFMGTGGVIHTLSIAARMYILMRPPVSTLYESIIFVGLVAVLYSLWMFYKNRDVFWLYLGGIIGALIQLVGFSHDQSGDSMVMLTAVLNTNFWLATHVVCITIGYAFCILTSGVAHYALYQKWRGQNITALFAHLHKTAIIALLFAAVGTVLGGIWADQSWGRFWGWDPKENGALLIVLWLIWVLHGRVSGQLKQLAVLAGLAYLSVIVALSWFGVNLLSVGLHAYGFTDSAAYGLVGFVGFETLAIAFLAFKAKQICEGKQGA